MCQYKYIIESEERADNMRRKPRQQSVELICTTFILLEEIAPILECFLLFAVESCGGHDGRVRNRLVGGALAG